MATTFVPETGQGIYNATSYCTLQDAEDYFNTLGSINPVTNGAYATAWSTLTDDQKKMALNQATYALDLNYGQMYLSGPQYQAPPQADNIHTQSLLFPRFTFVINKIQVIQSYTIPTKLKYAVCDVAMMYVNGINIFPAPNTRSSVKSEMQKVGELQVATTYGASPHVEKFPNFWRVEMWLKPYLLKTDSPSMFRM